MAIQSWEFLFVLNLLLVLVFPWLPRKPPFIFLILIFPNILGFGDALFNKADLFFFQVLCLLHFGVSYTALLFFTQGLKSKSQYFALMGGSAILSLLFIFTSPVLIFSDPFWGLVPGTVALDPIIGLEPYALRAIIVLISIGLWTSLKSLPVKLVIPFAISGLMGLAFPFWSSQRLMIPEQRIKTESFDIQLQSGSQSIEWQSKADEYWKEFQQKFSYPEKSRIKKILIFKDDDSKFLSSGARQTQIGHFLHDTILLSEVAPGDAVFHHELAHLYHGTLKAPYWTYLNPFIFEGLAVALSENSDVLLRRATALQNKLKLTGWPNWFDFYNISAQAAYTLAGAFAALAFQKNTAPWDIKVEISELNATPTEEDIHWAEKVLERKTLFKDNHRRDCTRLARKIILKPHSDASSKFEFLCSPRKPSDYYR